MKCKECGEKLTDSVSYWHGLTVHPKCFDRIQWRKNHLTLRERKKRMMKIWKKKK